MAGALTEDLTDALKFCANCRGFDWKQPPKDLLKRCTGCWEVWYCGDKCQKEHWHNTHKKHCKYLGNKKVLRNAKHKETTCQVCKEEAGVKKEEMFRESNPILPCTMSRANKQLMDIDESFSDGLPHVALAEMTGVFHTKVEATIATFMRILVKMKMTKHSLWQEPRTAVHADKLYRILWKGRTAYLRRILNLKMPGPLEGQLINECLDWEVLTGIADKMVVIDEIRGVAESMGIIKREDYSSLFKPWETLKVLTALLRAGNSSYVMKVADCVGTLGLPEEIGRIRTTFVQFNKMRDNVMNLLSEGLVPYTRLVVTGLCAGNPAQQCNVCREEVDIRTAAVEGMSMSPVIADDPVIMLGQAVTYTLCGRQTCKECHSEDTFAAGRRRLDALYLRLCGEHGKELCDYCGKTNHKAKGLRCAGCLTKLYCGVECQVKDIYHLQIKCEKGEKRKKKRSDSSRKKEGIKMAEDRQRLRMSEGNI